MATRGRPVLAAQSYAEAFDAVARGKAPKRPRNEFERMAGARTRGRRPSETCPLRVATSLASYLIQQGQTQADAVRRAREASAVPVDAANVRKYLKRLHPTVTSPYKGAACAWLPGAAGLVPPISVPLLQVVSDGD